MAAWHFSSSCGNSFSRSCSRSRICLAWLLCARASSRSLLITPRCRWLSARVVLARVTMSLARSETIFSWITIERSTALAASSSTEDSSRAMASIVLLIDALSCCSTSSSSWSLPVNMSMTSVFCARRLFGSPGLPHPSGFSRSGLLPMPARRSLRRSIARSVAALAIAIDGRDSCPCEAAPAASARLIDLVTPARQSGASTIGSVTSCCLTGSQVGVSIDSERESCFAVTESSDRSATDCFTGTCDAEVPSFICRRLPLPTGPEALFFIVEASGAVMSGK
mmetsp:Transcript_73643/g.195894  ORF Transcript_73643/g.195894 Transcript_73643/m.195894 type:complete len:281 (-) Transcript_73643:56-898(-)